MNDLMRLGGTHLPCTWVMVGLDTQGLCDCLCTFSELDIGKLGGCALGGRSYLSAHDQWRVCKTNDRACGAGDVVVVHGRHLRTG